MNDFNEL